MRLFSLFGVILCTLCILDVKAMHIAFRDVTEDDLPSLNTLMRSSKEVAGKYTKEYLDEFIRQLSFTSNILGNSKAKILLVDNELAGFYSFYIHKTKELELDNFFLDPKFLYKGYGKILWDNCLEIAKKYKDRDHFIIWSSLEALHFYLKRGCIKIGEKPSPIDVVLVQPMLRYNLR